MASEDDAYYPVFRLDFVSIVGRPRRPICRSSHFFDNITISLRHWHAPYSAKHVQGIHFDLGGRTFRIATGATREAWFIVMHPIQRVSGDGPNSNRRRRPDATQTRTALAHGRAVVLASYIKDIFLRGELIGEGIEPRWALGGTDTQMIAFDKWVIFQTRFMEGWDGLVEKLSDAGDSFWLDHQPAFHAYDYGANIEIEVTEEIANLEQETLITPMYHDDIEDDSDRSNNGDDDDDWGMQGQGPEEGEEHPDAAEDSLFLPIEASNAAPPSPSLRLSRSEEGHGEEFESSVAVETSRVTTSHPPRGDRHYEGEEGEREDEGDEDEDEERRQEERFERWMSGDENADITLLSDVDEGQPQQEREEEDELSRQHSERGGDVEDEQGDTSSPSTPPPSASSSGYHGEHDSLYGAGLRRLREALEAKYNLDNISYVSYALAVDVHCTAAKTHPGEGAGPAVCLLADRNRVAGEFYGSNYTFYPLGFHPAYGNFSSDRPPAFLDSNLFTVMKENMSHQNQGADVLSFGFFQGYSNLKRSIRHRPDDLLASHGLATGALTIPSTEAQSTARLKGKQQRLLAQLRGQLTPDNPGASTPFARERQRIEAAVQANEFAFRFEQVISIDAPRLVRQRRNFHNVLQPIFQLMRLFLKEKQLYAGVLRRFPPEIFPGMLVAFAKVLEAAIAEMDRRFREGGSKGLGMALSEGVAALDRLGNFCFTGDPRVLPTKVMRLLGTIDSLRACGWPFISPRMLDIREGRGLVNLVGWPQLNNGRPVLMHVASLEYHYDRSVAANRHSQLWFAELGGRSIDGLHRMTSFLREVFRDLWVPETVAFICRQVRRGLNRGFRSGGGVAGSRNDGGDLNNAGARAMVALGAWEEWETPFKLSYVQRSSERAMLTIRVIFGF